MVAISSALIERAQDAWECPSKPKAALEETADKWHEDGGTLEDDSMWLLTEREIETPDPVELGR